MEGTGDRREVPTSSQRTGTRVAVVMTSSLEQWGGLFEPQPVKSVRL
ncbi:hypothetical protein Esi_0281_0001 [Ectocarpus siliculosus]|uniref:Uncharacterized protein n=1 Tax=Ectocarpus siliculosus TaxID=2880 RepID=D8LK61_ECTSI|nr:hypothetical protein Esi_0281_0001 [Ectocarpus siliculosus]|eukprot:CBN76025.1 hypothetical protein Esi_0281_0001 [Ectocarpus siliculosus]